MTSSAVNSDHTILVIHRTDSSADRYKHLLQEDAGVSWQVVSALYEDLYGDGDSIFELCQFPGVDAVLLEAYGLDARSFEILNQLVNPASASLPPVIVLGDDNAAAAVRALKAGAADYLVRQRLTAAQLHQSLQTALFAGTRVAGDNRAIAPAAAPTITPTATEQVDDDLLWQISHQRIPDGEVAPLYEQILQTAIALTHADMGSLQQFDPERHALYLLSISGFDPAAAATWEWVQTDSNCLCARAFNVAERVVIPDIETCDFISELKKEAAFRLSNIQAAQATPLLSRSGQIVGMLTTCWHQPHQPSEPELNRLDILARQVADLIEQQQTQQALQQEEQLFAIAMHAAKAGWGNWNWLTGEAEWSDNGKRIMGFTNDAEAQTAQGWIDRVHPDDRPRVEAHAAEAAREHRDFDTEYRIIHPGGEIRWLRGVGKIIYDASETPVRSTGLIFDLTETKQTEAKLHRAAELAAFRIDLQDALRSLTDADEIKLTAAHVLGEHLQVDRVYYSEVEPNDEYIVHPQDYYSVGEVPRITGRYRIRDFSTNLLHELYANRPVIVADTQTMATDSEAERAVYQALAVRAFMAYPLVKADRLVAVLGITQSTPRQWTETEVMMVEKTAEWTWAAVERAQAEAALRDSQQQLSAIFAQAAVGLSEISLDGQFQHVNEALCRLLGRSREAVLTSSVTDVTHPDDLPASLAALARLMENGGSVSLDKRYVQPDGTVVWANSIFTRLDDSQGQPQRFIVVTIDMSDRKQAEAALREREMELQLVTDAVPALISFIDADQRYRFNNRRYEAWFDQSASGLYGKHLKEVLGEAAYDDIRPYVEQVLAGQPVSYEREVPYKGGTRYVSVSYVPRFSEQHVVEGFVAMVNDITQRKLDEAAIAADLEDTKLLHDLSTQFTAETDVKVLYSKIMDTAIALARADAGSFQCLDIQTGELRLLNTRGFSSTMIQHFDRIMASSQTSCGRALLLGERTFVDFDALDDVDGSLKLHLDAGYLSAQSTLLVSRSGQFMGMFSTHWRKHYRPSDRELRFLDLLARQAADLIEQRQTERERQQFLEREQAAREEAERANRIKDEFLAILSHELRSPLNPILGWAKLLQTRKMDETKIQQGLSTIERNVKLQTQLIDDLLDVAKILRGKLKLDINSVHLSSVIGAALEVVKSAALAKSITLDAELTDICQVRGDEARLQQIVWNLLSNAIKFTPSGGQVKVRLEQVSGQESGSAGESASTHPPVKPSPHPITYAQITVTDTGRGISPDFLPYIFQSFRQADTSTTRQYGGLGLGLSIVKHLVDTHGGTITVESPGEGQGATFIVRLPLLEEGTLPLPTDFSPKVTDLDLSGTRVLAVDDIKDARELLATLLAQYGAEVKVVASGQDILANLVPFRPDVLVCDIGMPDMDGYTLMRRIRSLPAEQGGSVPAIAVTAYVREEDYQRTLEHGFQRHIGKPIDPENLARAIAELTTDRQSR